MAHGAALATRLVQYNLERNGGVVNSTNPYFEPFRSTSKFIVPTLPNITFIYSNGDGGLHTQGLYDMILFTLQPEATSMSKEHLSAVEYANLFSIVDVILHPQIMLHARGEMKWPGEGTGPRYTPCMSDPCDPESKIRILQTNALGTALAGTLYLMVIIVRQGSVKPS